MGAISWHYQSRVFKILVMFQHICSYLSRKIVRRITKRKEGSRRRCTGCCLVQVGEISLSPCLKSFFCTQTPFRVNHHASIIHGRKYE